MINCRNRIKHIIIRIKVIIKLKFEKIKNIITKINKKTNKNIKVKRNVKQKSLKEKIIEEVLKSNERNEIYICANNYNLENKEIIRALTTFTKVLNIVTENDSFFNLDRELENQNIFITVSKNKRRALKNAKFIINIDFTNFKDFNMNRTATIIDCGSKTEFSKSFEGEKIQLNLKRKFVNF